VIFGAGTGFGLEVSFLGLDRIIVRLEEGRDYARNGDRHGVGIFAFVKLTFTAVAAAQASFADMVCAGVLGAIDANVDGRFRADRTVKHSASLTQLRKSGSDRTPAHFGLVFFVAGGASLLIIPRHRCAS
jgi:hypothetical protein